MYLSCNLHLEEHQNPKLQYHYHQKVFLYEDIFLNWLKVAAQNKLKKLFDSLLIDNLKQFVIDLEEILTAGATQNYLSASKDFRAFDVLEFCEPRPESHLPLESFRHESRPKIHLSNGVDSLEKVAKS
jgi:hypothetical protein